MSLSAVLVVTIVSIAADINGQSGIHRAGVDRRRRRPARMSRSPGRVEVIEVQIAGEGRHCCR